MNDLNLIRVLLVEDDEDDYVITRGLLADVTGQQFALDWAGSYEQGLEAMRRNQHDVCLVDYRLGAQSGLELLQAALSGGCQMPIIMLTGQGEHEVDVAAMKAGASDYLVKSRLDLQQLERSIRYAIERKRAAVQAAFEQARIAAFGAEVGLSLTRSAPLDSILTNCAKAMVQYLNAALAQLWVHDVKSGGLAMRACAGPLVEKINTHTDWQKFPRATMDLAKVEPLLIPALTDDRRLPKLKWMEQEKLVSFATYPLMLENRLVGFMSLFSRDPLRESVLYEMGSVSHGIALCIQRKLAQDALDASESRYRSVVESVKEIIFQIDEFGLWTFLNSAWTAVTGFDVTFTLGAFFLNYVYHEDREHSRSVFLQLMKRQIDFCRFEVRLLTKAGQTRWVECYMQRTPEGDGRVAGISGSLNDITERKQAEAAVEKLAAFPRVNPNPVLELNANGKLTYANEAALELVRSLGKELVTDLLPAKVNDIVRTSLLNGTEHHREEVHLGGHTITWSFFPVVGSQVVHCYGADITEMLNLEAQFRHAQKLESVGQMAAGIAHDFNNLLTVIQGYADRLLARHDGDSSLSAPLGHISEASRRAAGLTRQLLTFSRKQIIETRSLDLNSVVRNFANMLPRLLGDDIALEAEYAANLPQIEADSGMLEQVIMNLAVNARDAMPRGGQLRITTAMVDVDQAGAHHRPDARPGRFVCLTVTDTGCGMDSPTLSRLFEPFFSTKEVGKGTGLGLATVYGIVKQHQGWIEVTSQVRVGTTFRIFFPAASTRVETATEASDTPQEIRGGQETILVVEDEPILRELVREILGQHEYRILEAASGVEALKIWDESDVPIDLLLTDMVMPEGMTGRDLAEQLRSRKPDLKVIYTSGYSPQIMGREITDTGAKFLQKPYPPPKLAQMVRECLDASPKPGPALVMA